MVGLDPPKGKPYLVMVPSSLELDLKVLAAALGGRPAHGHHRDERHTACSWRDQRLALWARVPVLWRRRHAFDSVLVSAGQRGYDVRLALGDLLELTGASRCEVPSANGSTSPAQRSCFVAPTTGWCHPVTASSLLREFQARARTGPQAGHLAMLEPEAVAKLVLHFLV